MQKITPCLWFDNQAEEAANFYTSIFNSLYEINNAFDTLIAPSDFVLNPYDSTYSPLTISNRGKFLYQVSYLRKNVSPIDSISVPTYSLPVSYRLYQNYPNPFNASTIIQFDLPYEAKVSIDLYNILGQKVASILHDDLRSAGPDEISFSAPNLPSGAYFYRMTARATDISDFTGEFVETKKLVMIK